ncbi:hypothetical protein [Leptospira noguchii]|uniref:Uncharacterized protein n=2 Tax=Leptospira noguchii TaxID=28182 RepID=M6YG94_9LEPT|nr:hypothetical protein [Leptospira noguchii]EKR71832.1 hypothetical protein LEP1GSC041_0616 [Leptospira noguchii str. 2006001870]EMM99360.1 hypothetical protein LEP1GSC035_0261 [Leptospira noguchii str. 2007001578]EMO90851.1 hypothetical protein LEP1GSC024_0078 [Leptospira noguchii str. 2001034031]UOG50887.1 hypothetical protein MAL00_19190 [Leptospira noguchii]
MIKKILLLIFIFFNFCIADSERINCREELDRINFERDMLLTLLLSEGGKDKVTPEQYAFNRSLYLLNYYVLYNKSFEKEQKCEGDFFLKLFSPETKDLKSK